MRQTARARRHDHRRIPASYQSKSSLQALAAVSAVPWVVSFPLPGRKTFIQRALVTHRATSGDIRGDLGKDQHA
jgi:hypothetical protein